MKNTKLFLGIALVALVFVSCKDEKEMQAQKNIDTYVVYVDSLDGVDVMEAKENWSAIEKNYQMRSAEADAALANLKDKVAAQERIAASRIKYLELKAKVEADMETELQGNTSVSPKQQLRNALFGVGKIGDDMNFDWVNASNIHSVYQQFIHTAENNKDNYSREDWDEVKLMYEALDSRKNTVEKEGLSSEDNRKIAGLKFKFAPMLKVNRMGAKSAEMKKAKE